MHIIDILRNISMDNMAKQIKLVICDLTFTYVFIPKFLNKHLYFKKILLIL